jgi:hypothetical protein
MNGPTCRGFRLTWSSALALLSIFVLFSAILAVRTCLLCDVAVSWVVSDDLNEGADAIVVLGGNIGTRPIAAAYLYKMGLAKQVLVTKPDMEIQESGSTTQDLTDAV